jgi:hypothetical protein
MACYSFSSGSYLRQFRVSRWFRIDWNVANKTRFARLLGHRDVDSETTIAEEEQSGYNGFTILHTQHRTPDKAIRDGMHIRLPMSMKYTFLTKE